jgi:hypothetical protein
MNACPLGDARRTMLSMLAERATLAENRRTVTPMLLQREKGGGACSAPHAAHWAPVASAWR